MLALGSGSGRYAVGCEPYEVKPEGSIVLIEISSSRVQAIEVVGVSARYLVVRSWFYRRISMASYYTSLETLAS